MTPITEHMLLVSTPCNFRHTNSLTKENGQLTQPFNLNTEMSSKCKHQ